MDGREYDLVIIGGGMVGASLACALAEQPLRIAVVEAVPLTSHTQPSYDDRCIALSYGTRRIFEGMGLWASLAKRVTPITKIHISDRGHFGMTHMTAAGSGCEALGYIVENRLLGELLATRLSSAARIDLICPARLAELGIATDSARVAIVSQETRSTLAARLLVGADGGNSAVRKLAGIGTHHRTYGQHAVVANITPSRGHEHIAYERFTDSGPLALLPMDNNRCSLVWTMDEADARAALVMGDEAFLERLQERFGYRLGRFEKVGKRHIYPLSLIRARESIRPRLTLIGNAAHTLHPVAGQGFNLGIRDVAALAQVIVEALASGGDPGSMEVLEKYDRWRRRDQQRVTLFTDGLVRIFSNAFPPLVMARNMGLLAVDTLPSIKGLLMRRTMGLAGTLPRLARGLPL